MQGWPAGRRLIPHARRSAGGVESISLAVAVNMVLRQRVLSHIHAQLCAKTAAETSPQQHATLLVDDNAQMRILDVRTPPYSRIAIEHAVATLRWAVGPEHEESPTPRFFEAGTWHTVDNSSSSEELREIVFELLGKGSTQQGPEVAEREMEAHFNTAVGTTVNFENHAVRAAELRCPPGGGEELDVHQHCLDYGLCFIGQNQTKMYHPGPFGREQELMLQTKEGEGAILDGTAIFKPIARGDLTPGYAVHKLVNASASSWLRCYQVELK